MISYIYKQPYPKLDCISNSAYTHEKGMNPTILHSVMNK